MFSKLIKLNFLIYISLCNFCHAQVNYIFPSELNEEDYSIEYVRVKDPYEKINRKIFKLNNFFEKFILKPVTLTYIKFFPKKIQNGVTNILYNFSLPISFMNSIFIGKINNSMNIFWKFSLNSIFGVGGIYNFSDMIKLSTDDYNFSDTLKHYNVSQGAYIVLPLFGPSTVRNSFGLLIDSSINPLIYILEDRYVISLFSLNMIDKYSNKIKYVNEIENNSLDAYATIRSLYLKGQKLTK